MVVNAVQVTQGARDRSTLPPDVRRRLGQVYALLIRLGREASDADRADRPVASEAEGVSLTNDGVSEPGEHASGIVAR